MSHPVKYHGSCHCKSVQFTISNTAITEALQCNCSICRRKNAVMSKDHFTPTQFTLVCGGDNLSVYHWGDGDVNHYFCKTCGIYPFHDSTYKPGHYRVNLGCLEEIDGSDLMVDFFDGKHEL